LKGINRILGISKGEKRISTRESSRVAGREGVSQIGSFEKAGLVLDIALTSRCPLQCRYCSVEKAPLQELAAGEWQHVVSSFARLRPVELISLEGGEPLSRPDLPAILAACLDCARWVKVVTSGVLSFDSLPDHLLLHPRFYFELSLDGPREIHDFLRDGSGERSWNFLQAGLRRGIQMRVRSVISRHNLSIFEGWLKVLDRKLEPCGQKVGFSFDTLISPEAMADKGGEWPRLGLRRYSARGLLPSPAEMGHLFRTLKSSTFRKLVLLQTEPLRGCGIARGGVISFDPGGIFSFCCEAPRGVGSIRHIPPEQCLAMLDAEIRKRPCRQCPFWNKNLCHGCWTGQKCGMVGHWKARDCQALLRSMIEDDPPAIRGNRTSLAGPA